MTASPASAVPADAAPDAAPIRAARRPLGAYTDPAGRRREIVLRPAAHGTALVIDEDAATLADRRLVAHLEADEPDTNAALVCRLYLAEPHGRFARPVQHDDWRRLPGARPALPPALSGGQGRGFRLEMRPGPWGAGELRWVARGPGDRAARAVGLRDVVGALEAYEPACAMTERAIAEPPDPLVSTDTLAGELERLRRSPIVLNCRLRAAVQDAVADGMSLSQIAARCGHGKSRRTGDRVGDTSWLSRRIGLLPEAGRAEPSPWIHTDVLALIARQGLGLDDPRQVEPA